MILKLKVISSVVISFLFVSGPAYSLNPWETAKEQTISNNVFENSISNNTNTGIPTYNSNNIWNNSASDNNGIRTIESSDWNSVWKHPSSNNPNIGVSAYNSNNSKWKNSASDVPPVGSTLRDAPPGGPGDQPPGETPSPIGEGLFILILLSGGYFMLKRRYSKE